MADNQQFLETLCDLQIPANVKLSPDGQQILYSTQLTWGHKKSTHGLSTLWLSRTGYRDSSHKVTCGGFNDFAPAWNPDAKSIAFISDRAAPSQKWALYMLELKEGSEPVALTPLANESPIVKFAFSPDGHSIAYISIDEKRSEDDGQTPQVWGQAWRNARLRILNLQSKQISTLDLPQHVLDLAWSPDGTQIVIASADNPDFEERYLNGTDMLVINVETVSVTRKLRRLPRCPDSFLWARDRKLYICARLPLDKLFAGRGVYVLNIEAADTKLERTNFGIDDEASMAGLIEVDEMVLVKTERRLESQICRLDGEVLYKVDTEPEAWDVVRRDQKYIYTVAISNVNHPVEVFSGVFGDENSIVQLSSHGKSLEDLHFGTCHQLTFPSADKEVELDAIYLTPSRRQSSGEVVEPTRPLPTIVLIHGGPRLRQTNAFNTYYYMWTPYLLSLGYGILMPNYRGSSGRGQQWTQSLSGNVGRHDYNDVIASTEYAVESGLADRDNLIAGGYSHGGFLALCCSVRNGFHNLGWRFKAVIAGAAFCDADAMALTSNQGSIYLPEICGGHVAWNMRPDDTRNRQASPLWEVNRAVEESARTGNMVIPPMLMLHGDKDLAIPVHHAWGMRRALEAKALPFELVIYPDQGHLFHEQKFWIDMLRRVGRWCDLHTGGQKAAIGSMRRE